MQKIWILLSNNPDSKQEKRTYVRSQCTKTLKSANHQHWNPNNIAQAVADPSLFQHVSV